MAFLLKFLTHNPTICMFLVKTARSKALADSGFLPLLWWKGIWKSCFLHIDALQRKSDAYENHAGLSLATCCLRSLYSAEKKCSGKDDKPNPPSPHVRKQLDMGKSIQGKIRTRPSPKPCFCSICIYKSCFCSSKRLEPPAFQVLEVEALRHGRL